MADHKTIQVKMFERNGRDEEPERQSEYDSINTTKKYPCKSTQFNPDFRISLNDKLCRHIADYSNIPQFWLHIKPYKSAAYNG